MYGDQNIINDFSGDFTKLPISFYCSHLTCQNSEYCKALRCIINTEEDLSGKDILASLTINEAFDHRYYALSKIMKNIWCSFSSCYGENFEELFDIQPVWLTHYKLSYAKNERGISKEASKLADVLRRMKKRYEEIIDNTPNNFLEIPKPEEISKTINETKGIKPSKPYARHAYYVLYQCHINSQPVCAKEIADYISSLPKIQVTYEYQNAKKVNYACSPPEVHKAIKSIDMILKSKFSLQIENRNTYFTFVRIMNA